MEGSFTCGMPGDPPTDEMKVAEDQPELMCIGAEAIYECNVGGINVREVRVFFKTRIRGTDLILCQIGTDMFFISSRMILPSPILK